MIEADLDHNVGTNYYHMQQYFDCTIVLKRDKDNFSMVTFLKTPGAISKNITSVVKWTFDEDARDMVDEIAGIKSINSSAVFVSYKAVKGTCAIYLMFSHF